MRRAFVAIVAAFLAAGASAQTAPNVGARQGHPSVVSVPATTTGPFFEEDAGTVAHVTWDGVQLQDTKGNAWTQNGTVPQGAAVGLYPSGFNITPAGAGPFATTPNTYNTGAQPGSNLLRVAGDFTVCVIYLPTSLPTTQLIAVAGNAADGGWTMRPDAMQIRGVTNPVPSTAAVIGVVNVTCGGRTGTTGFISNNGATAVTAVVSAGAVSTSAALDCLGLLCNSNIRPLVGTMYEMWFASGVGPSDASLKALYAQILSNAIARRTPLISQAGATSHVIFNGTALVDTTGYVWTQQGTVPQVAAGGSTTLGSRPGAGPFSTVNNYSLGAGSDVLDFAGDFSACFTYNADVGNQGFSDGDGATVGYRVLTGDQCRITTHPGATAAQGQMNPPTAAIPGFLNVCCVGRAGTTLFSKFNLGTLVTTAGATITPATGVTALLGTHGTAGAPTLFEAWFSTATPTDALFTRIQTRFLQHLTGQYQNLSVARATAQAVNTLANGSSLAWAPPSAIAVSPLGAEVWGAGTNLVGATASDLSNAAWVKANATVATNVAADPFVGAGPASADRLTATAGGIVASAIQAVAATGNVSRTSSVYIKAGTQGTTSSVSIQTDAATTTCTNLTPTGTWQRVSAAGAANAAAAISIGVFVHSNCLTGTATAGDNIIVALAQLEVSPYPTPFTTATRNATDVTTPVVSLLHKTNRWCTSGTYTPAHAWVSGGGRFLLALSSGDPTTTPNSMYVSDGLFSVVDSTATQKFLTFGALSAGSHRLTACNNAGTLSFYLDAVLQVLAPTGSTGLWTATPPTATFGSFIGAAATNYFDGSISNFVLCPEATSYAECP
jgi:hypothetical protein